MSEGDRRGVSGEPPAGRLPGAPAATEDAPAPLRPPLERRLWFNVLLLGASVAGCALLSVAFGQDLNWDLLNYHYYNGYALVSGVWRANYAPAQIQTYVAPTLDALSYLAASHMPPAIFGALLGGLQGINFWLVFQIASRLLRASNPWLRWSLWLACPALAMYSPTSVSQLGTWMGDLTTSVPTLAGVLLLIVGWRRRRDAQGERAATLAAGALFGVAAGLKLTVAPDALAAFIAFALPLRAGTTKVTATIAARFLGGVFAGFSASSGYWLLLMTQTFGSPFFPLYNAIFRSPYATPANANTDPFFPTKPGEWAFLPFFFTDRTAHATLEIRFQDLGFAAIYVALAVAILLWIVRAVASTRRAAPPSWRGRIGAMAAAMAAAMAPRDELETRVAAFFVLAFALWEIAFSIYRYLSPLELLVPVVLCLLVGTLLRAEGPRIAVSLLLLGAVALTMNTQNWGRQPWGDAYFSPRVAPLESPENVVVIMISDKPISYLIPSFPQAVRFVRVQGTFQPHASPAYIELERRAIASRPGPFYLLTSGADLAEATAGADTTLAPFSLRLTPGTCGRVQNTVTIGGVPPVYYCSLARVAP